MDKNVLIILCVYLTQADHSCVAQDHYSFDYETSFIELFFDFCLCLQRIDFIKYAGGSEYKNDWIDDIQFKTRWFI